jgi:transcriptional regulator with XRE-family HTH domain
MDVIDDMRPRLGVRSSTPGSDFNYDFFLKRTAELGDRTDEERALRAGISLSTLYRLKRGAANPTLKKLRAIATNLEINWTDLLKASA